MTEQTAIQKVSKYMHSEVIKANFAEVVGSNNAGAYISSVLLAVANSDDLQKCSLTSIYISAMRAATLRLSVDPATGQAYLVPFGNKATLIVGYKGLYDMAVRTGKYRYINVSEIYDGESVEPDRISGLVTLKSLSGSKKSDKVIGWLGAFEMLDGFAHTLYMTTEKCQEHGKKYSKAYSFKSSGWQTDPAAMEKKTVLRLLLRKWGYLDPSDIQTLETIEAEPETEIVDVDAVMAETEETTKKDEEQIMAELGYAKVKTSKKQEQPELSAAD
jgi:recombination protein RecT